MSRFPMRFLAPALGSLVLIVGAGCEERNEMAPGGEPMAVPSSPNEDVNALRPTTSSAPGAGGAAAASDMDRMPVSGSDQAEPLGAGAGKGGHAGHAGHAGKHGH